ncbi:acyltransferase domain-containing protein [Kineosporia rhizophila]|uniref:acyltransferase domain-containing protein n=1 Tax=Kineosporia rhizophila TaxID=84633 RepID=UPI001E2C2500|nr:acyltransferase domain-containing protein [Kineosporia rhizophila]
MDVVFMLPGQGSQFPGMGQALYEHENAFRDCVDEFFEAYGEGAEELERLWRQGDRRDLARAEVAQPLLFAVTLATSRALLAARPHLRPVLVGHSVGELAAATLAGVMSIDLAAALIRRRAELLREDPAGGMVGCRAEPHEVMRHLQEHAVEGVIGADNGPGQCVVSLAEAQVARAVEVLREAGIACMRVPSTRPFHSPLMAASARSLGDFLATRADELRGPDRPLVSAFSGVPVTAGHARDPYFWTAQMALPVRFRQALRGLDRPGLLFVETGPGATLSTAARTLRHVAAGSSRVLGTQPGASSGISSWTAVRDELSSSLPVPR